MVEVHKSDFPQFQFQDARISDLIAVLDKKIQLVSACSGNVESVRLYGTRLSFDRRLKTIIPDLAGSSPRLVATMRARPIEIPNVLVVIETLTGKRLVFHGCPKTLLQP